MISGELSVQGYLWLYSELKASLGYMRLLKREEGGQSVSREAGTQVQSCLEFGVKNIRRVYELEQTTVLSILVHKQASRVHSAGLM